MTSTEELITAAMRLQAERRPDGSAVRAALAEADGRTRGRRVFVLAAAASAAAVAVGATVVLSRDDAPAPPAQPPSANLPPFEFAPADQAMAYEPTWLPDGFVEKSRSTTSFGVLRVWSPAPADDLGTKNTPTIQVDVALGSDVGIAHTPGVAVQGRPAVLGDGVIKWAPDDYALITVQAVGVRNQDATVLRIAQGMRYDGAPSFPRAIRPGSVSPDWSVRDTRVWGDQPGTARTRLTADFSCGKVTPLHLTVEIGPTDPVPSGPTTTVRGRTAHYRGSDIPYAATGGAQPITLSVPLDAGRHLVLQVTPKEQRCTRPGSFTVADLAKVAQAVVVDGKADLSWIGTP